jgi:hypothetical protein
VPNPNSLCEDDYLISFSFKNYHQAKGHYFYLAKQGLKITDFMPEIAFSDAVLWDQNFGPSTNPFWIKFAYEKINPSQRVRIAQFEFEDDERYETEKTRMSRIGLPKNWTYDQSITNMLPYERMNMYTSRLNH